MRKLRIVRSDTDPITHGTRVFDADTGEELREIMDIAFNHPAGEAASVQITKLVEGAVDVVADGKIHEVCPRCCNTSEIAKLRSDLAWYESSQHVSAAMHERHLLERRIEDYVEDTADLRKRLFVLKAAAENVLKDHEERVKLYGETQPNRTAVMEALAKAIEEAMK